VRVNVAQRCRTVTQVAEWAGHSVEVLLNVYAKCLDGQEGIARHRVQEALGHRSPNTLNFGTCSAQISRDGRIAQGWPLTSESEVRGQPWLISPV
jgi:hypothetical protein